MPPRSIAALALASADQPTWLARVSPVMTASECTAYRALPPEARERFESDFWLNKPITAEDYFRRLDYIDANCGSGKQGSGINTDPGRVYHTLGPPSIVTHLPSSRIFLPVEIWCYESAPVLGITSEVRLLFYLHNGLGI